MSTKTTNYSLVMPDYTDIVDVAVLNKNFNAIDAALKTNATAAANAKYTLPAASSTALGGIKLTASTTDIGKDTALAANTIYLVYEN